MMDYFHERAYERQWDIAVTDSRQAGALCQCFAITTTGVELVRVPEHMICLILWLVLEIYSKTIESVGWPNTGVAEFGLDTFDEVSKLLCKRSIHRVKKRFLENLKSNLEALKNNDTMKQTCWNSWYCPSCHRYGCHRRYTNVAFGCGQVDVHVIAWFHRLSSFRGLNTCQEGF